MPRFSIIIVHYQGSTTHNEFCRCANSIINQTYQDFEILAYHDGPLLDEKVVFPVPIVCMDRNYKDWGHTLRDRGIHEAKGDYIVHMNSDNLLYPNALEEIAATIDRPPRLFNQQRQPVDTSDIVVYGILARCAQRFGDDVLRCPNRPDYYIVLTGNPPRRLYIDAMQLVMKRTLWLAEGGWSNKTYCGDGEMYQKFATKYGYRSVEKVLGEHY
jgi:glycosyltransferase involved in cell wall biosynthesis